jgi:hypothetical protein
MASSRRPLGSSSSASTKGAGQSGWQEQHYRSTHGGVLIKCDHCGADELQMNRKEELKAALKAKRKWEPPERLCWCDKSHLRANRPGCQRLTEYPAWAGHHVLKAMAAMDCVDIVSVRSPPLSDTVIVYPADGSGRCQMYASWQKDIVLG